MTLCTVLHHLKQAVLTDRNPVPGMGFLPFYAPLPEV